QQPVTASAVLCDRYRAFLLLLVYLRLAEVLFGFELAARHLGRAELGLTARRAHLDSGAIEVIALGDLPVEPRAVGAIGERIEAERLVRLQKLVPARLE